ncbi:MAG TPA: hypothetical protein VLZ74_07665 [Methylocella sp.]|nr:hypothetical protein [Methylocella sp.]
MLDFIFVGLGLLLLVSILSLAKTQRNKILTGALPCAVEIARSHGWVSTGRLMTQANMTEKDARDTLAEACRKGFLFQGDDGRYYTKQTSVHSDAPNQRD